MPKFVTILLICIGILGCVPLYTAGVIPKGSFRAATVSGVGAPPIYIDGLHLTYGLHSRADLTMNASALAGALDEPGADLELRVQVKRSEIDLSLCGGLGYYLIDGGLYQTATLAISKEYVHFSPFLIHRLELDQFVRPKGKLYLGMELYPDKPLRLAVALGSRDVYHRDLFVLAFGLNYYFKPFSKDKK